MNTQPEDQNHRIEVDCSTGAVTYVMLTPVEIVANTERSRVFNETQKKAQADRDALIAEVKASTDPAVTALAKLAGIQ